MVLTRVKRILFMQTLVGYKVWGYCILTDLKYLYVVRTLLTKILLVYTRCAYKGRICSLEQSRWRPSSCISGVALALKNFVYYNLAMYQVSCSYHKMHDFFTYPPHYKPKTPSEREKYFTNNNVWKLLML